MVPPAGGAPADARAASGTRPRNTSEPSAPSAISDTRAGSSRPVGRSPGDFGSGSHVKVTRVLPFSPRELPIHVRTMVAFDGRAVADVIAASTGLGTEDLGGASARAVCSWFSAQ